MFFQKEVVFADGIKAIIYFSFCICFTMGQTYSTRKFETSDNQVFKIKQNNSKPYPVDKGDLNILVSILLWLQKSHQHITFYWQYPVKLDPYQSYENKKFHNQVFSVQKLVLSTVMPIYQNFKQKTCDFSFFHRNKLQGERLFYVQSLIYFATFFIIKKPWQYPLFSTINSVIPPPLIQLLD